MTDHFIVMDQGMAQAIRTGRKRQMRTITGSALSHCRPGDRIVLREAWIAGRIRQGRDHGCAARHAEFALFADGWRQEASGLGRPGRLPNLDRHGWVAAVHMPDWACRTAVVVDRIHQQHLQEMDPSDLRAEGLTSIMAGWRWRLPRPLPGPYRTGHAAFAAYWNTRHSTPGERWADNPPVTVIDFTLASTPPS